jgi:hypothetical protein
VRGGAGGANMTWTSRAQPRLRAAAAGAAARAASTAAPPPPAPRPRPRPRAAAAAAQGPVAKASRKPPGALTRLRRELLLVSRMVCRGQVLAAPARLRPGARRCTCVRSACPSAARGGAASPRDSARCATTPTRWPCATAGSRAPAQTPTARSLTRCARL